MEKVLVIDDDLLFREMILMALEEAGFETLDADDGRRGIELAREEKPDLVICDVRMDNVDGYGVLSTLRRDPETAAIPFILMTGMADNEGMREGMNRGADDYLAKPFSVDHLLSAVHARLHKQQVVRQQAEQKLEALRASITLALPHELRTPLNGIITSAQLLEDDAGVMSPDEIREFAGMVYTCGHRLHRLIENFLVYAQLEMLARDPNQAALLQGEQTTAPQRVVRRVAQERAHAYDRPADLHLEAVETPYPAVTISEKYLVKILDELIDNAFKFSEPGERVEVTARHSAIHLVVQVCDRGRGMDVQRVTDIGAYMQFERAVQEQQGTGLGLQIVKQLLELHSGSLQIKSTPGSGTSMTVMLPLVPGEGWGKGERESGRVGEPGGRGG